MSVPSTSASRRSNQRPLTSHRPGQIRKRRHVGFHLRGGRGGCSLVMLERCARGEGCLSGLGQRWTLGMALAFLTDGSYALTALCSRFRGNAVASARL